MKAPLGSENQKREVELLALKQDLAILRELGNKTTTFSMRAISAEAKLVALWHLADELDAKAAWKVTSSLADGLMMAAAQIRETLEGTRPAPVPLCETCDPADDEDDVYLRHLNEEADWVESQTPRPWRV